MTSDTFTLAQQLAEKGGWTEVAAVIDETTGETYMHCEVHAEARALAEDFSRHGIGAGDHVGLLVGDRPAWMSAFLALQALSAVPLVVNPDLDERSRSRMLGILPTRHVVSCQGGELLVERRELPETGVHEWDERDWAASGASRYYLFSSGTTGNPKAVAHASTDLPFFHDAVCGADGLDLQATDIIVSLSQYYFTYGFNNQFVYPLFSGASVVLSRERRNEVTFADALCQYGATVAFSVPSALARLADHIESSAIDTPASLRAVVSAGEPLPDAVAARIEDRWQVPVLNQIGSTEVGNAFCANGLARQAAGTAGRVCPGYDVALRADPDRPLPAGGSEHKIGSVWVSGPTIPATAITANGPEPLLSDGWLETKDYGYWADNGGLVVVGRADDFVHVGGISVSAIEIESAIRGDAGIEDCAVLAPLVEGVSTLTALVVLTSPADGADLRPTKLRERLRRDLDPFRVPKRWTLVPEIPRTASGKIMRHKLPALLGAGVVGRNQ
ncbi:class I adenylate-forming enzyme family protein [Pseudonocardia sp. ICBG162]|uniref:class I adenylate-forming enzyme family protein n=1 Tax=Pseudonocardia sp. ICBG162 TaxID=2846761 RepID=UPI001CF705E4|nr:AMP-binding protein [Pseudonocardia sp. ICBG162]